MREDGVGAREKVAMHDEVEDECLGHRCEDEADDDTDPERRIVHGCGSHLEMFLENEDCWMVVMSDANVGGTRRIWVACEEQTDNKRED